MSTTDALNFTNFATYPDNLPANAPFLNSPLTTTDATSWVQTYVYDSANGKLLRQFDGLGNLAIYTYTTTGLVQNVTDANGNVTSFAYSPEGFLASRLDPGQSTAATFTHTDFGWLATTTNPLGEVTQSFYDVNGNSVSVIDALQRNHVRVFDLNSNLIEDDDFKSQRTTYTYDDANERIGMVTRDGQHWSYQYSPTGKLAQTTVPSTSPDTPDIINTYDNADRLVKVAQTTSSTEYSVQTVYDAAGNPTTTIDRNGQEWVKTYDALNRVRTEKDPQGNQVTRTYDANGRIADIISPTGNTQHHLYDNRGRLHTWQDGEGGVWTYAYDGNGNILLITDALKGNYTMTYGPRNERLTETNQDNKTWTYTYDALLRPYNETDPNGRTNANTYNSGGQLISVAYSTGRADAISYDANNNVHMLTRTDSGGATTATTLEYDAMDRIIGNYLDAHFTAGFEYDPLGRRKTLNYPDGKPLSYSYDALGRLTKQTDWANRQLNYSYDSAGRLQTRTYPNGVSQINGYDNAGRLTLLRYSSTASNTTLLEYEYTYDPNNNLSSSDEVGTLDWTPPAHLPNETSAFTAAGRLVTRQDAADTSGKHNWSYSYDDAGNMNNATRNDGAKYQLTYDEQNRTTRIQWTPGQAGLSGAASAADITNHYDALGRRVSRTLNGTETRYALDLGGSMERVLCDTDATGKITAWYVHGPDLCYKITLDGNDQEVLTDYHADTAGNVVMLTGANATIAEKYAFTPYGRLLGEQATSGTLSGNPYRFAGSQGVIEELPGLSFMRARYYLAEEGVFLSTDPVKHAGPEWGSKTYVYTNGNPVGFIDADGNGPIEAILGAAVGMVAGFTSEVVNQSINKFLEHRQFDWNEVVTSTAADGLGGLAGGLADDPAEGGAVAEDYRGYIRATSNGEVYTSQQFLADSIKGAATAQILDQMYSSSFGNVPGVKPSTISGAFQGAHFVDTVARNSSAALEEVIQATTASHQASSLNSFQSTKAIAPSVNSGTSSSGGGSSITIPKGATLSGIAAQNNTTVSNLLKLNPQITNANKIQANAKLKVK